jgi:hypothetical protein
VPDIPIPSQPQQMAIPTRVQCCPVATSVDVDVIGPVICLRIQTPTGIHLSFYDADVLTEIIERMKNGVVRARSGLVIESNPASISHLNGHKHTKGQQ